MPPPSFLILINIVPAKCQ